MYTLTLCIGITLGVCGQIRNFDFPSYEECDKERIKQIPYVRDGYAVCSPKAMNIEDLKAKAR